MSTDLQRREHLRKIASQHFTERLSRIAGVTGVTVDCMTMNNAGNAFFDITFCGWSPTLHAIRVFHTVSTRVELDAGPRSDRDILADLTDSLSEVLSRQNDRSRAARSLANNQTYADRPLDFSKPLPYDAIAHLHTDIAYAAIVRAQGHHPEDDLRAALRGAHREDRRDVGGNALDSRGIAAFETQASDGSWRRIVMPHVNFHDASGTRAAVWEPRRISLYCGPLPQTLVDTMIGRPLGSIISIHPLLDDRIIRSVIHDDITCSIGIDSEIAPVLTQFTPR